MSRRDRLARLVAERGFLRVSEAGDELGVSLVTVRSDLNALQASGALRRVHGGAVSNSGTEASFERSLASSADEKSQIAQVAAGLVESGSTVLLDVGSTTALVGRALVARAELHDVTVITNGLTIALELESAIPRFQVIVTGGTLRPLQHSLVDPLASVLLGRLTADIAFVGCNGVHAARGVTNVNIPEAELKRLMIASAQRVVVVADGSKIGGTHVGRIAALDEVESLITGASAPAAELARLRAAGLAVRVAG